MHLKYYECLWAGGGTRVYINQRKAGVILSYTGQFAKNSYQYNLHSNYASTVGTERIWTLSVGLFRCFLFKLIEFGLQ
mgnify:CR=1 FL=1